MVIKQESIFKRELNRLRREVYLCAKKDNPEQIEQNKYTDLSERIRQDAISNGNLSKRRIDDEIKKTDDAIKYGYSVVRPDLSSAYTQLLWGLTSTLIRRNPDIQKNWTMSDNEYAQSRIWKSLKDSTQARKELLQQSLLLSQTRTGGSYYLRWGDPKSWFYQHPTEKLINIDLEMAMICGLDNTRSVAIHEIGHAELSLFKPQKLQDLVEEIEGINKKRAEKGSLAFDEYKRLNLAIFEQRTRHSLWNAIEDNCVNRYAINHSERVGQNLSKSLNRFMAILEGSPDQTKIQKEWAEGTNPWALKLANLSNLCLSAVFLNNGLFKNTYQDWYGRNVYPDWLSDQPDDNLDTKPLHSTITQNHHLMRLLDLCDGLQGVGHLQPSFADRRIAGQWDKKSQEYCRLRNEIITQIWDTYAEPLFKNLRQEKKLQLEQILEDYQKGGQSCPNGIPIEGFEDMPLPEGMDSDSLPPDNDPNPDKGQSVQDILEGKSNGEPDKIDKPNSSSPMSGRGSGSGGGLDKLPIGNWSDYQAMVKQYQTPIQHVARLIRDLKRSQIESIIPPDAERTLLPTQSFEQFNLKSFRTEQLLRAQGRGVGIQQMKHFDQTVDIVRTIDPTIILSADGSGSMGRFQKDQWTAMGATIQGMCIFTEACRLNDMETFGMIWGGNPIILWQPGDDNETRGRAIHSASNGMSSGTDFAPSIRTKADLLVDYLSKNPNVELGYQHHCVWSDGDLFDRQESCDAYQAYFKYAPQTTVDFAILNKNIKTSMDGLAEDLKLKINPTQFGTLHQNDPSAMVPKMVPQLIGRMRQSRSFTLQSGMVASQKMRQAQQHIKMT